MKCIAYKANKITDINLIHFRKETAVLFETINDNRLLKIISLLTKKFSAFYLCRITVKIIHQSFLTKNDLL